MQLINSQNMSGTVIQLDGHHFEKCTVTTCVLVYAGGDFSWTNSRVVRCQLRFVGAAQRTVTLLRHFGLAQATPQAPESTEPPSTVH